MKLIYSLTLSLFLLNSIIGQNLKIPELTQICGKPNWDAVNDYLTQKGWEYYSSKKGDDENYNTVTWAYQKNNYNDKAQGWFYLFTYTGSPNKIAYSFRNKQTYNAIKAGLTSGGFKSLGSEIKDEAVVSKYANANYIVTLSFVSRQEDEYSDVNFTSYYLTMIKKSGVYDEDNGLKKNYDDYGNLTSEYVLKDGKINGNAKSYFSNGKIKISSNFLNGLKNGLSIEYNEDGEKAGEFNYRDGKLNGQYKLYENGKLTLVGNMLNETKDGNFKKYYSNGNLEKEYTLKNGQLNGNYTEYYYRDSKPYIKIIGTYLADNKIGQWQVLKLKEKGNEVLQSHFYKDGERDGFFKEVSKDSIIFGQYKNGLLHGQYNVYTSISSMLFGELTGDTTNSVLISSGRYNEGKKSGYWKNYSVTKVLTSEGAYYNDEKVGEWKYYYDNYSKSSPDGKKSIDEPFSKKLFLIESYDNGKKNGKEIRYSYLEDIEKPCDTVKYKNSNPLDTCHELRFSKVLETAYYKNDQLHGPFEYKDSTGKTLFKGNFVNGKKEGEWIDSYEQTDFGNKLYQIFQKGEYKNGKREGLWLEYIDENFVYIKYNYENGKLNGETEEFKRNGQIKEEKLFENGKLKTLNVYDSIGRSVVRTYEILQDNASSIICKRIDIDNNGKLSQEYFLNVGEGINHNYFEVMFILKTGKLSNGTDGYKEGEFKYSTLDEKPIVIGNYKNNNKTGLWKYYYYDIDVLRTEEYSNNTLINEYFTKISDGKPFSGHFTQSYNNGKKKFDIKVEKGLRDGKSKYFNEQGEITNTEKYGQGILQSN